MKSAGRTEENLCVLEVQSECMKNKWDVQTMDYNNYR